MNTEQQTREKLETAVRQAAQCLTLDEVCTVLTDQADALLCDALGVTGASRWWRRYTLETCGRAVGDMRDTG